MKIYTMAILSLLALNLRAQLVEPSGHTIVFKGQTVPGSVQVYTCNAGAWTGPDPDAIVLNANRSVILHHYKGPTWEAADGSIVHGSNAKHFPAPQAKSVDWLELTASGGTLKFAKVDLIHRVETSGGVAPAQACDAAHNLQQVRVPYSATYLFYAPGY